MQLSDIELRLLDVFIAVVESQGIANAQTLLNRDASTISRQLRQLEERLELRLCERGRSGFQLTPDGEKVFRSTLELKQAVHAFEDRTESLKGHLSGEVRLAIIDNLITDPNCPLRAVLARYGARSDNKTHLHMEIMSPPRIEHALLDHQADLGIGIFLTHLPELHYEPMYEETDWLVCAPSNPLAEAETPEQIRSKLQSCAKVARNFLGAKGTRHLGGDPSNVTAWVANLEAEALLILAGTHVGFLPNHYVRNWIESGQMVAVRPDHFHRKSVIEVAFRRGRETQKPAVNAFREDLFATLELCGKPASRVR
ncbi:LysR family transcriptional regulator [Marinobacter sp. F3R11]|uniref:LysR family transcriptional regulator n=1 Tax=Marinobacter sp. F3R11 TaxID=2267231 RepID=UPI000DEAFD18|nr:LysR family transcriptional regulator [Marinobacter sp. F3R11]RBW48550.1 LysR family transcriptional regulator [Marinobacter sp. F3R11]